MKKILNIAASGMNLKSLDQIKILMRHTVPENVHINWVNLIDQHIDVLLINEAFFDLTNIQKIIAQQKALVFKLVKNPERGGQIDGQILFYPLLQIEDLKDKLHSLFFDYDMPVYNNIETPHTDVAGQYGQNPEKVFNEIFTARNGFIQLFDHYGQLALIDCMTERIWPAANMSGRSLNRTINQSYATGQQVQETSRNQPAQDMRTWLWHKLMHASDLQLLQVKPNECFRLDIWPKFEKDLQRRDQLKMAACFAAGARLKEVQQTLGISQEQINRFVETALLLKMGEIISPEQVKFTAEIEEFGAEKKPIRNFLSKLRKKLGL